MSSQLLGRVVAKGRRALASACARRTVGMNHGPLISFTFDDAPKTAFHAGGDILRSYGARATFFVSLGLLGTNTEVGPIADAEDLLAAVKDGHELGCHTFDHVDAWHSSPPMFIGSIVKNARVLHDLLPGTIFQTFAYPKTGATLTVKRWLKDQFMCCRGGGQTCNVGKIDLALIRACFLDRRTRVDLEFAKLLIDYNVARRGWLVFATHDISVNPSPYGCTPGFLAIVAEYAARSGAVLLPMGEACETIIRTEKAGSVRSEEGPLRAGLSRGAERYDQFNHFA